MGTEIHFGIWEINDEDIPNLDYPFQTKLFYMYILNPDEEVKGVLSKDFDFTLLERIDGYRVYSVVRKKYGDEESRLYEGTVRYWDPKDVIDLFKKLELAIVKNWDKLKHIVPDYPPNFYEFFKRDFDRIYLVCDYAIKMKKQVRLRVG